MQSLAHAAAVSLPCFDSFIFLFFFPVLMWCSLTGERVCRSAVCCLFYTGFWLHSSMRYARELTWIIRPLLQDAMLTTSTDSDGQGRDRQKKDTLTDLWNLQEVAGVHIWWHSSLCILFSFSICISLGFMSKYVKVSIFFMLTFLYSTNKCWD